jgi:RNA polymerase sigma-70 factor (ECF subfamily)
MEVEQLRAAYQDDLRRFVAARTRADRVDDVCQEVWAGVVRGLAGFRGETSPRVWLFAIARHKLADAQARERPYETLESSVLEGGALAEMLGVRAAQTPTREIDRRQRAEALARALAALDAADRELLELRFVIGLKPAAIVETLGLDVAANTLSQRLVRLVHRLREALRDESAFA